MASFSFGAGNARKLAGIPLYAAGRLATLVVPRSRDRWVIGCAVGIADGALALAEVARRHGRDPLWLTGTPAQAADASARGIRSVAKNSVRGFWATARAGVVVVTHGLGDANRYALGGAYLVQLWHGIPLKRIGIDSPETVRSAILGDSGAVRRLLAAMYRFATRRISLVPAASELVRGRLESAFSLGSDRVPVTGEPRVDVLSQGTPEARREAARARLAGLVGSLGNGPVVLYAPTWRDGDDDPAIPGPDELAAIVETMTRVDGVLLVRSHPLGAGRYTADPGRRVRLLGSDLLADVTPILPGVDVLVTDYSSIVFDAALVPVPAVFLAPDVTAYALRRGFYGRYEDVADGSWARTWGEALPQIEATAADDAERARRLQAARALSARVHRFSDGRNAERVYRAIEARRTGERMQRGRSA